MKRFLALALLIPLFAFAASPNPAPIPTPKATVTFTQGTVSRTLPAIAPTACLQIVGTVIRAKVGTCNNDSGSYVQFPSNGGSVSVHWSAQDACTVKPAPLTRHADCPAGTKGSGWTQTATYTSADAPTCWVLGPYLPTTPPAGTCTAVGPPPFQWQAPIPSTGFIVPPQPAKGSSFVGPYGLIETRVTDHAHDLSPYVPAWLNTIYSRHQGLNADGTLLVAYRPDGGYQLYNTLTLAAIHTLTGVGGDPEFQWSPTDPNVGYYLGNNGSTVLRQINVQTNASSVLYDFTADVRALLGSGVTNCDTGSEGSPSADNVIWFLRCRHQQSGTWPTVGYIAINTATRHIVWSKVTTVPCDSTTATPSGRWGVCNGTATTPTIAYATNGTSQKTLLDHGEHIDTGSCNGHDQFIAVDYSAAGNGAIFKIDIDTSVRSELFRDYQNPFIGDDYAVHISAKAECVALMGFYQGDDNKSNLVLVKLDTLQVYGVAGLYSDVSLYQDEPHCFISRNGRSVYCNENFQHSGSSDVYRIDLPTLPTSAPAAPKTNVVPFNGKPKPPAYHAKPSLQKAA